jgi:hypothetical protein
MKKLIIHLNWNVMHGTDSDAFFGAESLQILMTEANVILVIDQGMFHHKKHLGHISLEVYIIML